MIPLGSPAPEFDLPTIRGENVTLDTFKDKKALVVIFMCNHCPYVLHVLPGLVDLANDYKEANVAFIGINSNDAESHPEDSFKKMKEYADEYGYPFVYAHDESQDVAKAYHAACTPDFYVFNEKRELVYRGQMDDSRPGNRIEVTGRDLRAAIEAVLKDKEVDQQQKPSTGCSIKWK